MKTLSIHKDNITSVERVAGHIWSTSTDGEVIVWEPEVGSGRCEFESDGAKPLPLGCCRVFVSKLGSMLPTTSLP